MNWLERLNRANGTIPLGDLGTAQILYWAHNPALPSNVPHRHAYFEVCLVTTRGSGTFHVGKNVYPLTPGTVFFARPGTVHQIRSALDDPLDLLWVSFQITDTRAPALALFADSTCATAPDDNGKLRTLWNALEFVATQSPSALVDAQITALASALLLGLIQAGEADSGTEAPTAHAALRFIHDHLNRPLSVEEVAWHLSLSPRHLTRILRDLTGLAPAAYIETARLTRARFLLLRTDDPLKHVAAQVGYASIQHFTRAFTRTYGCPPGAFRASKGALSRRPLSAGEGNIGQHV